MGALSGASFWQICTCTASNFITLSSWDNITWLSRALKHTCSSPHTPQYTWLDMTPTHTSESLNWGRVTHDKPTKDCHMYAADHLIIHERLSSIPPAAPVRCIQLLPLMRRQKAAFEISDEAAWTGVVGEAQLAKEVFPDISLRDTNTCDTQG